MEKKDSRIKLIYIFVCILISLLIFSGILIWKDERETSNDISVQGKLYKEEISDFGISTSYGDLVFPKEWEKYIETEIIVEEDIETVQFWVSVEGKEKLHVFDISFGGEGLKLGSITNNSNEVVNVCIMSYTYEIDDTWSDQDIEILKSIEHDINYLIEELQNLDNYISDH